MESFQFEKRQRLLQKTTVAETSLILSEYFGCFSTYH